MEVWMIMRSWRGRASTRRSDDYPKHFRRAVVPDLRGVPGFLGAHLSQRRDGDRVEFLVLTRWESMEAVRAFAGPDVDKAVVEPGAVAALDDFDDTVRHYEVLEEVLPAS
jgi:heme-degrading monooxygenase HmoA